MTSAAKEDRPKSVDDLHHDRACARVGNVPVRQREAWQVAYDGHFATFLRRVTCYKSWYTHLGV